MGGFGFSKSKSKSSSEPVDVTPQAFKDLQQPFADVLAMAIGGGDSGTLQGGIPLAPGPTTAPIGVDEVSILEQLMAKATGESTSVSQDLLGQTAQGGFLTENPFLEQMIETAQRPGIQALEELLSRVLPGRFTQAGQFTQPGGTSAFDRAAAIATRATAQSQADIAIGLAGPAFESERGRQQEAAIALPQVTETEINTLISNLQAQALPRLIAQFGVEEGTRRFNEQINALLQVLAITSGTTQAVIGQKSEGKSSSSTIQANILK